ncbi:hypothetical protein BE15_00430 [Sorangium cellulosum]|uniref:Cytochrome c domain-containing protein n=1 Tax=Sorangium cellulosum TaxID=56 RepID=A0A150QIB2_SORCE|nr:hypothetical protein BE15_00430 [Sorangium cellulosum]
MKPRTPTLVLAAVLSAACSSPSRQPAPDQRNAGVEEAATPPPSPPPPPSPAPPSPQLRAGVRTGGALARSPQGDALYLADEDHAVVRRIPLPVDVSTPPIAVSVPGRPAQVLALDGRVLVTIRDPGLLLVLRPDPTAGLVEVARVPLPADAWGLAITPDERTALVTGAWTGEVSAVDLATATRSWSIDVPREPRGVVVREDGAAAYITHLTSAALTRIDLRSPPRAMSIALPASPYRAPPDAPRAASLGYAAALSPDGRRLFVARHALGALGDLAWFGAATVDVLQTGNDEPLAPRRREGALIRTAPAFDIDIVGDPELEAPRTELAPFVQPRALVYRASTRTLLVASEGTDALVELDALSVEPTLRPLRTYPLGSAPASHQATPGSLEFLSRRVGAATLCGAPSGVALSRDESQAWVYCRSTDTLAIVRLDAHDPEVPHEPGPVPFIRLAEPPRSEQAAIGRKLFYNATDWTTSGGLGCAGCHPDGRDDGHVWHEVSGDDFANFFGSADNRPMEGLAGGVARQTPMLAGRVSAEGPYGWNAQSESLAARIREGFGLHRWGMGGGADAELALRASHLASFLREGLAPPPRETRPLTPEEKHGFALFTSEAAQCSRCHVPETEYTDRTGYPMPGLGEQPGFYREKKGTVYKTPSLRFVAGTAPYYHDGSARTLEELVEKNEDRMGRTSHMSRKDKAALVAFLRTL